MKCHWTEEEWGAPELVKIEQGYGQPMKFEPETAVELHHNDKCIYVICQAKYRFVRCLTVCGYGARPRTLSADKMICAVASPTGNSDLVIAHMKQMGRDRQTD